MKRVGWSARLAALGVPTVDGRMLDPMGRWQRHMVCQLLPPPDLPTPRVVGAVRTITVTDGWLTATGVVTDPVVCAAMRAGEVWPELSLINVTVEKVDGGQWFTRGTVAAVRAGRTPAWPDIRFNLED